MSTMRFFILPVFLLLYIAIPTLLLSFLQLFLCKKELKWGRILPLFSITISVLMSLIALFFNLHLVESLWWLTPLIVLAMLVLFNIPTLVYFLIYRTEKMKRTQEDINRTRIDDLE